MKKLLLLPATALLLFMNANPLLAADEATKSPSMPAHLHRVR